jgi:hypothetical protein
MVLIVNSVKKSADVMVWCTVSAVSFSTRKTENTPVFYNSEALHITNTVWNTSDYGDRFAGFRMVLILNATKGKKL